MTSKARIERPLGPSERLAGPSERPVSPIENPMSPNGRMIQIETRLRALETRSRWLSRALAALLLPAAFAVIAGASPAHNVPDVLAARRFHLIDENGALVGRWIAELEP